MKARRKATFATLVKPSRFPVSQVVEGWDAAQLLAQGKKMPGTRFVHCTLPEADFTNADLSEAAFEHCALPNAVFHDTQLTGADFTTATDFRIDPEANQLQRARFALAGLPGLLDKYDLVVE